MSHVPLASADVCLECYQVADHQVICSYCGGRSLLSIAPILEQEIRNKSKIVAPCGIELKVGQVWHEVDPRFDRNVVIVGIYPLMPRSIAVRNVKTKRLAYNSVKRFTNKSGGYKLVRDAEQRQKAGPR